MIKVFGARDNDGVMCHVVAVPLESKGAPYFLQQRVGKSMCQLSADSLSKYLKDIADTRVVELSTADAHQWLLRFRLNGGMIREE